MIVVRVELWSAITGRRTELARMRVCNVGGTMARRDYDGATLIGRSADALDRGAVSRTGVVRSWPSERLHVWNLVAAVLRNMGYSEDPGRRNGAPDKAESSEENGELSI